MFLYIFKLTLCLQSQYCNPFQKLSSKVTLTHDVLPENVRVVYEPICEKPILEGNNKGICDDVHVGQQVSVFIFTQIIII